MNANLIVSLVMGAVAVSVVSTWRRSWFGRAGRSENAFARKTAKATIAVFLASLALAALCGGDTYMLPFILTLVAAPALLVLILGQGKGPTQDHGDLDRRLNDLAVKHIERLKRDSK